MINSWSHLPDKFLYLLVLDTSKNWGSWWVDKGFDRAFQCDINPRHLLLVHIEYISNAIFYKWEVCRPLFITQPTATLPSNRQSFSISNFKSHIKSKLELRGIQKNQKTKGLPILKNPFVQLMHKFTDSATKFAQLLRWLSVRILLISRSWILFGGYPRTFWKRLIRFEF